MSKYIELLNKMSAKQKISLIADIHNLANEEYVGLGVPRVKFVTLEELFAKSGDGLTPYNLARTWDLDFITKVTKAIIERTVEDANIIIVPSPKINLGGEAQLALAEDPLLASQIAVAFLSAVHQCKKIGVIPDFCLTSKEVVNMDLHLDQKVLHDFICQPFSSVAKKGKAKAIIGSISKQNGAYEEINRTLLRAKEKYFSVDTDMLCICKTYDETISALEENCIIFTGVEIAIQNAHEQYLSILSSIEKGRASMLNLEEALDNKTAISDQTLDMAVEKVLDFAFHMQQLYGEMNPTYFVNEKTDNADVSNEDKEEIVSEITTNKEIAVQAINETDTIEDATGSFTRTKEEEQLITLAIAKSSVLLKNESNILPLKEIQNFAILDNLDFYTKKDENKSLTDYFNEKGKQNFGIPDDLDFYTKKGENKSPTEHLTDKGKQGFAILGDVAFNTKKGEHKSFADYFTEYARGNCIGMERGYKLFEDRNDALLASAVALAEKATTVFVFLQPRKNSNSSYPCTSLPANQTALIYALSKCNCKVIAILSTDINVDVTFSKVLDGLLLAPIEGRLSAKAIVDVLCGRVEVGGKLTASFYASPSRFYKKQRFYKDTDRNKVGIFIGYRFYDTQGIGIQYPFGFGLRYANVEMSNVMWTPAGLSINIINKSDYAVDETIEVYVGMSNSNLLRPKKELKAFQTVHLEANKNKQIYIKDIDYKTYDAKTKKIVTEQGDYTVYVGTSVNKIQATLPVSVNGEILFGETPKISDYLQAKSNIISNQFILEAKHTKMVNYKTLRSVGFICLVVAILVGLMSIAVQNPFIPLIIGAVFLLVAVTLFGSAHNLKVRVKLQETELIEKNKKLFEHAETAVSEEMEKLFLQEFKFDASEPATIDESGEEVYVDTSTAMLNENMSFSLAASDLKTSAGEFGVAIDSNCASNLIASFVSSKLIIAKTADADTFDTFVDAVANYFGANVFTETITDAHKPSNKLLYVTDEDGTSSSTAVLQALLSANENSQVMHIVYLKNLQVARMSEYLIPYVKYFSNPHSNAEVSVKGSDEIYTIPDNVWFITDLEKGALVENVPAYLLEYATVLPVKHVVGEVVEEKSKIVPITLTDIEFLMERCKAKFSLSEDIWKKIDAIETFVFKHTSYKIGNKLWLRIENYLATLLSMETEVPVAIDCTLASVILPTLSASLAGKINKNDKNIIDEIERVFGEDNVQISHEMLVSKA